MTVFPSLPFANIWISSGSISINNWRERRLDILNVNPPCYSIPWPNRNEENNLRKFLPSEVHKSNRNREFKIPDQKAQHRRRRKYWFGSLADSFSIRSVFIFRGKTPGKTPGQGFLGNSTRWYRKFLSFAQTAETVYNSRPREQDLVTQGKLEDNKVYRLLASVKEAVLLSRETSEVFNCFLGNPGNEESGFSQADQVLTCAITLRRVKNWYFSGLNMIILPGDFLLLWMTICIIFGKLVCFPETVISVPLNISGSSPLSVSANSRIFCF